MAGKDRHKYNDFDDSNLRLRIDVGVDFPYKKELINILRERGYYNETIAERLAYTFFAVTNHTRYEEIALLMSAVISLKKYHKNRLCISDISNNNLILSDFATELFTESAKRHILGILGRTQSENFGFLKQFVYNHPAPRDNDGSVSRLRVLNAMGTALSKQHGKDFDYYGLVPKDTFEGAVQDTYERLCRDFDFHYPWRGYDLPLMGAYDQELYTLCAHAFDDNTADRKHLEHLQKLIEAYCTFNASNSPLFRMLEDYDQRTYYFAGETLAKRRRFPAPCSSEQQQIERLRMGLFPEKAKSIAKLLPHLSRQYIYYVLSGNVLAPEGYIPHSIAALLYDIHAIVRGSSSTRSDGLSAKEKHKNIIRSFEIDSSTGLYKIGM